MMDGSSGSPPKEIVPGAPASPGIIDLASPDIGERERVLVDESLRSGWIAYGSFVDRFEENVSSYLGVRHAVALASGTAALHVALIVAGVRSDDEVPVSGLSFVAPANAIRYLGAWPVFIDAEPDHAQLDVEVLERFLADECTSHAGDLFNRRTGRRVAALLPVDILGHPADLDPILDLGSRYGLPIIEDAAEGLGAHYRGGPVGGKADIGCLSFNGNKIVTSGGGGMLVTNDANLADRARYLVTQAKDDPLEYVHGAIGFNYRLSNIHAALGCAQFERLEEFVSAKRAIAQLYEEGLREVPGVRLPREAAWAQSTYWLYTVEIDAADYGMGSRELLQRLVSDGIQARPLWQPLDRSPAHAGPTIGPCEVAYGLHQRCLSIPCSVSLRPEEQARVIGAIRRHARHLA